jgi:hypothetical protein
MSWIPGLVRHKPHSSGMTSYFRHSRAFHRHSSQGRSPRGGIHSWRPSGTFGGPPRRIPQNHSGDKNSLYTEFTKILHSSRSNSLSPETPFLSRKKRNGEVIAFNYFLNIVFLISFLHFVLLSIPAFCTLSFVFYVCLLFSSSSSFSSALALGVFVRFW